MTNVNLVPSEKLYDQHLMAGYRELHILHDLHYENVMIRPSTDELVIIDPIQDEY